MVKFNINDDVPRCVIFGESKKINSLFWQLNLLGIRPEAIAFTDICSLKSFECVPVIDIDCLRSYVNEKNLLLIPAFDFHGDGVALLKKIDILLTEHAVRQIEYLSMAIVHGKLNPLPDIIHDSTIDILIGMQLGFVMGGVETWISNLYHALKRHKSKFKLLEPVLETPYQYVGADFYSIDVNDVFRIGEFPYFTDYVLAALHFICTSTPNLYIDNGSFRLLSAVWLAKKKLNIPIKVISVLHGDDDVVYNRIEIFNDIIDEMIAVSSEIKERVVSLFPNRAKDIEVKLQVPKPSNSCANFIEPYPIRLAYAARLEPVNKRSLWLKDFVDGLFQRNVNFTLDIAGDGNCRQELEEFMKKRGYAKRVNFLGSLPRGEMDSFWKNHQVFINFSKSEGGPLTLFESMGHGLVPVVTDAGCGKQLVSSGENGFLIETPEEAVEAISILYNEPQKIAKASYLTKERIWNFYQSEFNFLNQFYF